MSEKKRYKRFCPVCKKVTEEWFCCGTKTRRLNMQRELGTMVEWTKKGGGLKK